MAGWTCADRKNISWDGVIHADGFIGDGSQVEGVLHLDQTTPQTITDGQPNFSAGLKAGNGSGSILGGTPMVNILAVDNADNDTATAIQAISQISKAGSFGVGILGNVEVSGNTSTNGAVALYGGAYDTTTDYNPLTAGLIYEVQKVGVGFTAEIAGEKISINTSSGTSGTVTGMDIFFTSTAPIEQVWGLKISDIPTSTYDNFSILTGTGKVQFGDAVYSMGATASYNLDLGTIDPINLNNIPAGFKPNYYGLPILDMGVNALQFGGYQSLGGIMGSLFRLDNRGYYPYFNIIRQPADDTGSEFGDLAITTSGKTLVGAGWNFSTSGTSRDEDLQVYDRAFIGDTLNVASVSGDVLGVEKLTNGTFTGSATGWTLGTGWAYSTNQARKNADGTGTLSQLSASMVTPMVNGETYELTFTSSSVTSGGFDVSAGGVAIAYINTFDSGTKTYRFRCIDDTADLTFAPRLTTDRYYLDAISLKKVSYTGGTIYSDIIGSNNSNDLTIRTGTDKTLVLEESVWNDIQFAIGDGRVGSANYPDWDIFTTNTKEYNFAVNDYIDLGANELMHDWKEGTAVYPHLHITLDGANTSGSSQYVKFTVYFAYADANEVWTETSVDIEEEIPTGTADMTHILANGVSVALANNKIGSQVKIRVKRIAATTGTEYPNHIFVTQMGIHYEVDTMGSRTVNAK